MHPLRLALLASLLIAAPAWASDAAADASPATEYRRKGVGFTGGSTSGIGYAWRQTFANGWGYHVGGAIGLRTESRPVMPPDGTMPVTDASTMVTVLNWSLGGQVVRVLAQNDWLRFYALAGLQGLQVSARDPLLNGGAGVGIELGRAPGVTFAVELPLVLGYRFGPSGGWAHLLPIPNALLMYNF